jgi:hypothetical protein
VDGSSPCRSDSKSSDVTFPDRPNSSAPPTMPLAFDGSLLIVVVTLLEMSLGVSLPAGDCANREPSPTLPLFEIRDQVLVGGYRLPNGRPSSRQRENHNDKLHLGSVM